MSMSVEVSGDKEFKDFIKKEGTKIIPRVKFGLSIFLNKVADLARIKVPVKTGRLQSSIKFEVEERHNQVSGEVGTNVKYGKYIELGTSKMRAQPYLMPAFNELISQLAQIMKKAIKS